MRHIIIDRDHYPAYLIEAYIRWFSESWLTNVGYNSSFRYFDKPYPHRLLQLNNHISTTILIAPGVVEPYGYGHLDRQHDKVWLGVAITRPFRNMGIGRIICNHLFERAIAEKISEIWLSVDNDNSVARHLYKTLGFSEEVHNPNNIFMKKVFDTA
jgi:RimJ/RimL family protein N-acetyltransferase